MCLLISILLLSPRLAILVMALSGNEKLASATVESHMFVLLCGWLFMPWTVLAYVFTHTGGITGLEWVILIIAVVFDLSSMGGSATQGS